MVRNELEYEARTAYDLGLENRIRCLFDPIKY